MDVGNQNLPEKLKMGLRENKNFQKCFQIAEEFNIYKNGTGVDVLDNIFERVMKGQLPPNKIAIDIKEKLNIDQQIADNVAREMNEKIFKEYKEELNLLYKGLNLKENIEGTNTLDDIKNKTLRSETIKKQENTEINSILAKLSFELEKEKERKDKINKHFKDNLSSKIEP